MNDPAEPAGEPIEEPIVEKNEEKEENDEADTPAPEPELHTKEELRLALKAFRKRLRLTRLDDDLGWAMARRRLVKVQASLPSHRRISIR